MSFRLKTAYGAIDTRPYTAELEFFKDSGCEVPVEAWNRVGSANGVGSFSASNSAGWITFSTATLTRAAQQVYYRAKIHAITSTCLGPFQVKGAESSSDLSQFSSTSESLTAGESVELTLNLIDAYGNPSETDLPETQNLEVSRSMVGGAGDLSDPTATDPHQLTWTFSATGAGIISLQPGTGGRWLGPELSLTISPAAFSLPHSPIFLTSSSIASGSTLQATLQLRDRFGNAVSGRPEDFGIEFNASGGPGSVGLSALTGASATAHLEITGVLAGTVSLRAQRGEASTSPVALTILPGPAHRLEKLSGDLQTGIGTRALPLPLVVRVLDAAGNPTQNGSVEWTLQSGGGVPPGSLTGCGGGPDGAGLAECRWTLGRLIGSQGVMARLNPDTAVVFTATGNYPQISSSQNPLYENWDFALGSDCSPCYWFTTHTPVTLTNTGSARAQGCTLSFDGSFEFTATGCSAIEPGSSCSVQFHSNWIDDNASLRRTTPYHLTLQCQDGFAFDQSVYVSPRGNPVATAWEAQSSGPPENGDENPTWTPTPLALDRSETALVNLQFSNPHAFRLRSCQLVADWTPYRNQNPGTVDALMSENCTGHLEPGATCDAQFSFQGDYSTFGAGLRTRLVCGNGELSVYLKKSVPHGTLRLSKTYTVDFGLARTGKESNTQEFVFYNSSRENEVYQCSAPLLSNTTDFSIVSDGCGSSSLPIQSRCAVTVKAHPTSVGTKLSNLTRTCLGGGVVSQQVSVTGITEAPLITPEFTPQPAPLHQDLIGSGNGTRCVVMTGGKVACWGKGSAYQLGNGDDSDYNRPAWVHGLGTGATTTHAISVSVGHTHACALMRSGTVRCWGSNSQGQTGLGTASGAADATSTVAGLNGTDANSSAIAVSTGVSFSCAILTNRSVQCWGDNTSSQLGNGTVDDSSFPVPVSGLNGAGPDSQATGIFVGSARACAITVSKRVLCWGRSLSSTPQAVAYFDGLTPSTTAVQMALTQNGFCASLQSGQVLCWGVNNSNRGFGDGTTGNVTRADPLSSSPVRISAGVPLTSVTRISGFGANANNTNSFCALTSAGDVYCWGNNVFGQVGDLGNTASEYAKRVNLSLPVGAFVSQISVGQESACAVISDASIRCWGTNSTGELGDLRYAFEPLPKKMDFLPGLGSYSFTPSTGLSCGSVSNGTVRCWGAGRFGNGITGYSSTPVTVPSASSVVSLSGAVGTTYALTQSGPVYQWGSSFSAPATAAVNSSLNASTIHGGGTFACRRMANGSVSCWGTNSGGQLGDGTLITNNTAPGSSTLLPSSATHLATGLGHACAVLNTDRVVCWGTNRSGSVGQTASFTNVSIPMEVGTAAGPPLQGVQGLALGYAHSCALLNSGRVVCWGDAGLGQLGPDGLTDRYVPIDIGLSGIQKIVASRNHTCALSWGGEVSCWGENKWAQLGITGSYNPTFVRTPTLVPYLGTVVDLFASTPGTFEGPTCAVNQAGDAYCWGPSLFSNTGFNEVQHRRVTGF